MSRRNLPFLLKTYLLFGTLILVAAGVFYTTRQVRKLNEQSRSMATLFAEFTAEAILPAIENEQVQRLANRYLRDLRKDAFIDVRVQF